jgi:uncharacterized protein (TIGR02588 family)
MKKNVLEWTVFAISLAVIAAVAGLLLHEQFTTGNGAPDLTVAVGRAEASGQGYAVPLDVRNGGDTSAEDVEVTVTLQSVPPEQSDVTIPYVPYRSMRRAWVMFSREPGSARLDARVISYRER